MNEFQYKSQIQRFLSGQDKRDLDAFHIYQWIERCHIQGWWKMAVGLSSSIPPGSLTPEYQKRLEVLLKECRIKQDDLNEVKSDGPIPQPPGTDRRPVRKVIRPTGSPAGTYLPMEEIHFDNDAKQTLRQIYSVLYYMQRNHDFVEAVRRTKDNFNIAYQSVDDKCARRFAGSVDAFQRWYRSGEILQRLKDHFHLNYRDYQMFEALFTNKIRRTL